MGSGSADRAVALLIEEGPPTAACLNPRCGNQVTYRRGARGRQPYFCSDACRAKHSQQRARLRSRWEELDTLAGLPASPDTRALIETLKRETVWEMERYGRPGAIGFEEDQADGAGHSGS